MDGLTLFGISSTALGVARATPQLVRLLRSRHARGVSVDSAATSMIVSCGWTAYGLLTHQPVISFASGAAGIIFAVITLSALPVSVLAANLPQVWVAYREKNLTDVSLGTWLLAMSEGLLWGGYGLVRQDIAVLVNNIFQLTTSAMIAALKPAHMARHATKHRAVLQVAGDKHR
ncbi:MAG: hypothetical protein MUD16_11460 [Desulfobacterales bacterium]|jgi:uncharacterized protein with PQ loop repeat|nr:hypothetical protein [Desulfobacterales bacterium]